MRFSNLFGQTLRNPPSDAIIDSYKLLIRAGFIRSSGTGIFSYLHLAKRSMMKIETIMREEMDKIGGQEILMPVVQPSDVWKETGRWYQIGPELGRFKDRNNRDMILAMTHEEVVADLARHEIQSYKHLPRLVYHIQTKWRDESRSRAGLIRVREFTMKDSYSLDADEDGLEKQYRAHYQAYFNIFHRCDLDILAVESDADILGGESAHVFVYLTPIGEEKVVCCANCGYIANHQVARFSIGQVRDKKLKRRQKIYTPGCKSIEDLANYLGVKKANTAKAIFFIATIPQGKETIEKFIFIVIRGDIELNESKLAKLIGARQFRFATENEIKARGFVPGYASPIDLNSSVNPKNRSDLSVVVDQSVTRSPNLVAGANEVDYHFINTNSPRDYQADIVADIGAADEGYPCCKCEKPLHLVNGIEVGNIYKLGTRYSDSLHCTFLDKGGRQRPIVMGSYGIGVSRLLASIAENHHDENGLVWPITVAPYQVHLIKLGGKGVLEVVDHTEKIYQILQDAGIDVLYDDRDESPGIKFSDADLIGLPLRITVGQRNINQGVVELKLRKESNKTIIPITKVTASVKSLIRKLEREISEKVILVPYAK